MYLSYIDKCISLLCIFLELQNVFVSNSKIYLSSKIANQFGALNNFLVFSIAGIAFGIYPNWQMISVTSASLDCF